MPDAVFFRVIDDSSQTSFDDRGYMLAADPHSGLTFNFNFEDNQKIRRMRAKFLQHLNRNSRAASPFISVFASEDMAWNEAFRREAEGRRNIQVVRIFCPHGKLGYRKVRKYAKELGVAGDRRAWNHSMHEFVFLHRIPAFRCEIDEQVLNPSRGYRSRGFRR